MIEGLIDYGIGCATTALVAFRIHRHMCIRIAKHLNLENECQKLEKHREAIDSGLPDETPPKAGAACEEVSLWVTHPGALVLNELANKRAAEKMVKTFDTPVLSTKMDEVRVETDQDNLTE